MAIERLVVGVMLLVSLAVVSSSRGAELKTFTIQEPFGLAWGPDRVSNEVGFDQGAAMPGNLSLRDAKGDFIGVQLSDVTLHTDGSIKSARVSFMARLQPNEMGKWTLLASAPPKAVNSDLQVQAGDVIELANSKTGIRLAGGKKTFGTAAGADQIPCPIQGVRLPDGKWIGKGEWRTDIKCTGYSSEVTARGPVFAQVKLRYEFEGGKFYAATVELNAGQDLAVVSEEFNLSAGKSYPMTGLPGMKEGAKYAYVIPNFDTPDRALTWDWWGQTHAMLPTPNAYWFSFGDGFAPDSAEFTGYNKFGHLKDGDGGLTYETDGRFAYVNAFPQYGDEETPYLGLYNSKRPASMLAVVGLRPSQWLHPDIDPHPDKMLKQYTQTTCITFERRKTGEALFRAPVCLGKRVYGIGGMERTLGRHIIPDRNGPRLDDRDRWGDDLVLRRVRMGRLELDTIKDWVLDYDEKGKYPRLFVPEGDRARYESRRMRKPIDEVKKLLDARTLPTEADKKVVTDAIGRASYLVRHFAQIDKNMMDYGLDEGPLSDLAEDALSSPACSPQQAKELRKWLAAISYFALHGDFVPPRESGFAWGSANMMAQVQCRACRIVALLPNHPQGKVWRRQLAKVVTLYVLGQMNEAGVTLECPHYGGMEIVMPAMGLLALASAGDVDLAQVEARLRSAAHVRLATLLPYDVRGGFRSQVPEGDGYYSGEYCFAPLAGFFQKKDPALARNLTWGFTQSNNDLGQGQTDQTFKLLDVGLEPQQPKLGSEHIPGYGFLMRSGFPSNNETYVQAYAGSFCWGHGHPDRGTWVMYAKGAPLMVDFAAMYTPSFHETWLHAGGLTFNHDDAIRDAKDDGSDDWWRKGPDEDLRKAAKAPFTNVQITQSPDSPADMDRMGVVTDFKTTPQADYAQMQRNVSYLNRVCYMLKEIHGKDYFADAPVMQEIYPKNPFQWTRQFVLVKDADPMGHNYLVVRDDLSGNKEFDPYLNLWCLATKLDVQGQVAIYTGQHNVDLHCYVAEPAEFKPKVRTVGHPCAFGFAGYYKAHFGKAFREDQIQLQIPQSKKEGGYFVAMVPVKQGHVAPKFETLAGGKAIRVTFPDRVDTIVLQPTAGELTIDGRKIVSTAAVIVQKNSKSEVTELAGQK